MLPAAAAAAAPAARPPKFRVLDRDGICAAGEVLSQGGLGWAGWRHGCGAGVQRAAGALRLGCRRHATDTAPHLARPPPPARTAPPQARCW